MAYVYKYSFNKNNGIRLEEGIHEAKYMRFYKIDEGYIMKWNKRNYIFGPAEGEFDSDTFLIEIMYQDELNDGRPEAETFRYNYFNGFRCDIKFKEEPKLEEFRSAKIYSDSITYFYADENFTGDFEIYHGPCEIQEFRDLECARSIRTFTRRRPEVQIVQNPVVVEKNIGYNETKCDDLQSNLYLIIVPIIMVFFLILAICLAILLKS